jgi:hypothetical protein
VTAPDRVALPPETLRSGPVPAPPAPAPVDAHHPNPAISAILDNTFTTLRIMPPDGFSLRLPDGTVWTAFVHRANGLP